MHTAFNGYQILSKTIKTFLSTAFEQKDGYTTIIALAFKLLKERLQRTHEEKYNTDISQQSTNVLAILLSPKVAHTLSTVQTNLSLPMSANKFCSEYFQNLIIITIIIIPKLNFSVINSGRLDMKPLT